MQAREGEDEGKVGHVGHVHQEGRGGPCTSRR